MRSLGALAAALAAATVLAGCTGQAAVSNTQDSFSFGGQVAGRDSIEVHQWSNSQSKASVSWGGQVGSGSFTLTIHDASGRQVYVGTIGAGQSGMSGSTGSGTPGEWKVTLAFHDFTGQMGLHIGASGGGMPGYGIPGTWAP